MSASPIASSRSLYDRLKELIEGDDMREVAPSAIRNFVKQNRAELLAALSKIAPSTDRNAIIEECIAHFEQRDWMTFTGADVSRFLLDALKNAAPETCPRCEGTGIVDVISFVDPSKRVKKSCSVCKGKGTLP